MQREGASPLFGIYIQAARLERAVLIFMETGFRVPATF